MGQRAMCLFCLPIVACGFDVAPGREVVDASRGVPDAMPLFDGPGILDAGFDAVPPSPPCTVAEAGPQLALVQVGADGGNDPQAFSCPSDKLPIGLAVFLSDQNTDNGPRSAHGIQVSCADVMLTDAGPQVTNVEAIERKGAGTFNWGPSTLSTEARCQPGWLIAGASAYISNGNGIGSAYVISNVAITCAAIARDGSRTGATEQLPVIGSGNLTVNLDAEMCSEGVATSLATRTGAGIDAFQLSCHALTCD